MADPEFLQQPLSSVFFNDDWMSQQVNQDSGDFNVSQSIRDLTDYVWNIFACAPIFDYNFNSNSIEKLREDLKSALSVNGVNYTDFKLKTMPLLAYSENDEMAVQIAVFINKSKFYEALLISRGAERKKSNHYTNLPVLLCRGSLKLTRIINSCLEKLFDFSLSSVTFTVKELLSTLLIVLKNGDNFSDDTNIELKFRFYEDRQSTIVHTINRVSFMDFWESICDSQDMEFSFTKIINLFYDQILTNFRRMYGIDVRNFNLEVIKVDRTFVINSKGMVKSKVPEMYDFLLKYLTQRINFEKHIPF